MHIESIIPSCPEIKRVLNGTQGYLCILFIFFSISGALAQQKTIIEGETDKAVATPISLTLCEYINVKDNVEMEQPVDKKRFKFEFNISEPGYFILTINDNDPGILLIEPGDSIHVSIKTSHPDDMIFTGKGAKKLEYFTKAAKKFDGWFKPAKKPSANEYKVYFSYLDSCRSVQLNYLNSFRAGISPVAYRVLWSDIFYDTEYHKILYLLHIIAPDGSDELKKIYTEYAPHQKQLNVSDTLAWSRNYINYLYYLNQLDFNQQVRNSTKVQFNFKNAYDIAAKNYTGHTGERFLAYMLLNQLLFNATDAIQSKNDYLAGNYREDFKEIVAYKYNFIQKFSAGKPEIDFSLPDIRNNQVALKNLKGKIVFLDFWFNGCVGCAASFKAMKQVTDHFKNDTDVVFLNVSVDRDRDRWLKGINLYQIYNDVNLYTAGKGEENDVIKAYGLSGYPAQFLIGKDGNYITGKPPRPDADNGRGLIALIESSLHKQ